MKIYSESNPLKVILHGGAWSTNIGNAFLQLGAKALIEQAIPEAKVVLVSGMSRWFYMNRFDDTPVVLPGRFTSFWRRLRNRVLPSATAPPLTGADRLPQLNSDGFPALRDPTVDMMSSSQCDLLVVPGMVLCREYVRLVGPSVIAAVENGAKVLFLGAGAEFYDDGERKEVCDFIDRIKPIAFSSRDDRSFDLFGEQIQHSSRGIDCAFFIPDAFDPHTLHLDKYIAACFDTMPEPQLSTGGLRVIRPNHCSYAPVPESFYKRSDCLVSDLPEDYLTCYANAEETHSDRVHACVASLAYGVPARFYGKTPRSSLFSPLGLGGVHDSMVQPDMAAIKRMKDAQIVWLREAVQLAFFERESQ